MIQFITPESTLTVRHPVLRKGLSPDTARFDYDYNSGTFHLGYFQDGYLIGVISLGINPFMEDSRAYQLRGMAVLDQYQGKGIGRELLHKALNILILLEVNLVWCNARLHVTQFYETFGFQKHGDPFEIHTVGPHFRMLKSLKPEESRL